MVNDISKTGLQVNKTNTQCKNKINEYYLEKFLNIFSYKKVSFLKMNANELINKINDKSLNERANG